MVCLQHDQNEFIAIPPRRTRFALPPGYLERTDQEHRFCGADHSSGVPTGLSGQGQAGGCGAGGDFSRQRQAQSGPPIHRDVVPERRARRFHGSLGERRLSTLGAHKARRLHHR